jgi:hypothetical protein
MAYTAKSHKKKSTRKPKKKANALTNKTTKHNEPINLSVESKPQRNITKKWDATYKTVPMPFQKVPICAVPKFKIYWVNTIKTSIDGPYDVHIYKIISNETNLVEYFNVPVNAKYAHFVINQTAFIFKVDSTAENLSSKELDDIKNASCPKIPIVFDTEYSRKVSYRILLFKKLGIYSTHINVSFNRQSLDFSGTLDKVAELNTILKKKCPNLSLHVDYIYNMVFPNDVVRTYNDASILNYPVLCLYNEHGCISSIELDIHTTNKKIPISVSINSKTDALYENKKYNKLLRCVSLIIMRLISPTITMLSSDTVNPTSTYLLMKYFGGRLIDKDFFKWIANNNVVLDPSNYRKLFNEYYEYADMYEGYGILVDIDINEETIKNAERLFIETVSEISCT